VYSGTVIPVPVRDAEAICSDSETTSVRLVDVELESFDGGEKDGLDLGSVSGEISLLVGGFDVWSGFVGRGVGELASTSIECMIFLGLDDGKVVLL